MTAFGGPAAHIGMMHTEVVKRRKWLSDQHFLDLLGATNLIPGPNSTEMAIHIGFLRAGWPGLIVAGVCFILPAMLVVMALAWGYVRFGSAPAAAWLLYGIKPVVMAIIVLALWALGRKAAKGPLTACVGLAVFSLYFLNVNEIALLFAGGLIVMLATNLKRLKRVGTAGLLIPLTVLNVPTLIAASFSLPALFFTFLKIGAVLYGSGYVLLAFLRADFVLRLGLLTQPQMIASVSVRPKAARPGVSNGPFFRLPARRR